MQDSFNPPKGKSRMASKTDRTIEATSIHDAAEMSANNVLYQEAPGYNQKRNLDL
jgi:hypothetical protein